MAKKTVADIDAAGKRVLVRVDFNVPLDKSGNITDDQRIVKALPTIRHLLEHGGRVILMSHLGRPKGGRGDNPELSLRPAAERLGELLGKRVTMVPDCIGPVATEAANLLLDGDCCLLENLRYHKAETIKDKKAAENPALKEDKTAFARQLADLADVYVNDAFGTCHRDNASMVTVPQLMGDKPKATGFLVKKELDFLGDALADPKRPFVAVLGGAKVSDKIGVIESLVSKCDTILIGGAMSYTFALADGEQVGDSLVEPDRLEDAKKLRALAGDKLMLPADSVVAAAIDSNAATQVCESSVPDGMKGLDIGPKTIEQYRKVLLGAKTIVWNGPMGVFETPPFDRGTRAIAEAVAGATDNGAVSIIGGGDSAAAVELAGVQSRVSHISTGGGASLEFLEGKPFQAIELLDDVQAETRPAGTPAATC